MSLSRTKSKKEVVIANRLRTPNKLSHHGVSSPGPRRPAPQSSNAHPSKSSSHEWRGGVVGGRQSRTNRKTASLHEDDDDHDDHDDHDLNNLLNFSVGRKVTKPRKVVAFCKETFTSANYHFVVSSESSRVFADPDAQVDWATVQEVSFPCEKPPCCPICLELPAVPKITRCGHIFCFVCILRYLSGSTRRCPLCSESVYKQALKSLTFQLHPSYLVNDAVEFELVKRFRETINPIRLSVDVDKEPIHTVRSPFARIVMTEDISDIVQREREALIQASEGLTCEDELSGVREAIEDVTAREDNFKASRKKIAILPVAPVADVDAASASIPSAPKSSPPRKGGKVPYKPNRPDIAWEDENEMWDDEGSYISDEEEEDSDESEEEEEEKIPSDVFLMYQAHDGQRLYLHPLNFRMLAHCFAPSDFPTKLTAFIVSLEHYTQTKKTRRRFRVLSHLPLRARFAFAFVDLSLVVDDRTLKHFETDLRRMREQQEREEHRNFQRAQREQQQREERERAKKRPPGMVDHEDDFPVLSAKAPIPPPKQVGRHKTSAPSEPPKSAPVSRWGGAKAWS